MDTTTTFCDIRVVTLNLLLSGIVIVRSTTILILILMRTRILSVIIIIIYGVVDIIGRGCSQTLLTGST